MLSGQGRTSHIDTDTGVSPGAEASPRSSEDHSSEIAADAVLQAPQSHEHAAVEPQAPVEDAPSSETGVETESAVKLSPAETEHHQQAESSPNQSSVPVDTVVEQGQAVDFQDNSQDQQARPPETQHNQQAESDRTQYSVPVNAADEEGQPVVDSQAVSQNQQARPAASDEPVSDSDSTLGQHQSVNDRELQDESVDSHSDSLPLREVSDSTVEHDHYHPVNDAEQSRPTVESNPLAAAAEDDDADVKHTEEQSEQQMSETTETEDNNDVKQHLEGGQTEEQIEQQMPGTTESEDDDVKQHLEGGQTEGQSEQLMPGTTEPANDENDSEQHNVHTDEVADEPDDSVDTLPTSDNIEMQLNREDLEGKTETTLDEQFTAAADKGSVDGYLAPLVNLWAAVDTRLIICIDSVSSNCVINFLCHCFFTLVYCLTGIFYVDTTD